MLKILVDNSPVDIASDFSFTYEKKSPLFMEDTIEGSLGYNISFPGTKNNQKLFGFPARLELVRVQRKFAVWVIFSGRLLVDGIIEISQTTKGSYSAYITDAAGTLADEAKELNIRDIDYGADLTFSNKGEYTIGTDDYCLFEVANIYFFKEKGEAVEVAGVQTFPMNDKFQLNIPFQNRYDEVTDKFKEYTWDGVTYANRYNNIRCITPFPFLNAVLRKVFAYFLKVWTPGDLAINDDLKRLCFYSNFDITTFAQTMQVYFTYTIPGGNGVDPAEITTPVFTMNIPQTTTFKWANIIPDMTIKALLASLQNLLCGSFDFLSDGRVTWIGRDEVLKSLISEDWSDKIIDNIDTKVQKDKGLIIEWTIDGDDGQTKNIVSDYVEKNWLQYKGTANSYAELLAIVNPKEGDFYCVGGWFIGYILCEVSVEAGKITKALMWNNVADDKVNLCYKLQREENTKLSTDITPVNNHTVLIKGSRFDFPREDNPCGSRLMMYSGKIAGKPAGSSYRPNNADGSAIAGRNLDLVWYGPNGLFNRRWKMWADFLTNAIPVSFKARLSPLDIEKFDFTKKKRIRQGEMLIESISVTISTTEIAPAEIKARIIR